MKLFVIFQVLVLPFTAFVLVPLGLLYSILLFFWLLLFIVQLLSHVQRFATAAHQGPLSTTNSQFAQTHVHCVGDAIQSSYPLSPPSPLAFNLSQHQGLFQWVSSSHGGQRIGVSASASILPRKIQDLFSLVWTGWISLQSKGLPRAFSNSTIQKHQSFSAQLSL